jgi:hypothetical protein
MENFDESYLLEFTTVRRRDLLPWWIKLFCWFFMLFGVAAIFCLVLGLLGYSASMSFYGFETQEPTSPIGLLIIATTLSNGYSAFLLWFEKDYAIGVAKANAIGGIALCVISMIVMPFFQDGFKITFRLELVLLIIYYRKLSQIESSWQAKVQP